MRILPHPSQVQMQIPPKKRQRIVQVIRQACIRLLAVPFSPRYNNKKMTSEMKLFNDLNRLGQIRTTLGYHRAYVQALNIFPAFP